MKKTDNTEKNLNTKEYNLNLINKYIIRSKKIEGYLDCRRVEETPCQELVSDECSSYSESEKSETTCSEDCEEGDDTLRNLNVYKNRRL